MYGGVKGSYYWVKSLLEHPVHLGLASHGTSGASHDEPKWYALFPVFGELAD
jgi:hypothetical protein